MQRPARLDPSPFHPDLRPLAALLPRRATGPRLLAAERRALALQERRRPAGVEVVTVGDVTVRLHRPESPVAPGPALLWIHGGGLVLGTAAQDDPICRALARRTGCLVAAVNYRLAPEHRFPVALEDCYDALAWLLGHDDVDPDRVALGGASAGGGLAAALAMLVRDRDLVRPVLQLLVYPMLDDRTVLRTDVDERWFRLWDNTANAFGWRAYTGVTPGSLDVPALAAPARAEDLNGLPPAWIGVGTRDLFHDEDLAYAGRLTAAGVPCETEVVDGAFHGFDSVSRSGVARRFRDAQVAALRRATAPTDSCDDPTAASAP